ncbi:thiol-disulfide oxidoreductase dcc [Nitzschia inconspicua]|uniref:Thiol-disulfide oxidoreductase dcc n=1 Tax=Nitzschia inconspicua TaxID=303405 RepID=A0A9K3PBP6_9STRA|nr:thiol-disulfide oxidoreductase dcc [Nitzschia inconspicua]
MIVVVDKKICSMVDKPSASSVCTLQEESLFSAPLHHDYSGDREDYFSWITTTKNNFSFSQATAAKYARRKEKLTTCTLVFALLLLLSHPPSFTEAFSSSDTRQATTLRSIVRRNVLSSLRVASINPHGEGNDKENSDVAVAAQKRVAQAAKTSTSKQLSTKNPVSTTTESSTSKNDNVMASLASAVDFEWEPIAENVFEHDQRPVILFDGVCNLCNGAVNFAIDHDSKAKLRFASLQSKVAQSLLLREGKIPAQTHNITFVTPDTAYFNSQAVSMICAQLDSPVLKLIGKLGKIAPKALREPIYELVSRNRFVFGESDSCRLDLDGKYVNRFVPDPTVDNGNKDGLS